MRAGIDFDSAPVWYDRNAEAYRASAELCDPAAERAIFLENLAPGSSILDVGCGTGRDMALFRTAGHSVTGLDPSAEMRRIARARLGLCVPLRAEPVQEFRDPEGSWDAIWAMASLLHVPMALQAKALSRLYHSLSAGGRLYACWKTPSNGEGADSMDAQGRPMCALSVTEARGLVSKIFGSRCTVWPSNARASSGQSTCWTNILLCKP